MRSAAMDSIEFKIGHILKKIGRPEEWEQWSVVEIYINGVNLISLLRDHELPFSQEEGNPDLAGGYGGLGPDVAEESGYFLGEINPEDDYWEGKVPIYVCGGCGDEGCWPMLVKIEAREGLVLWSEFEQPHRNDTWDYASFGPFLFDRTQYDDALKKFVAAAREWRAHKTDDF
jgi:hypothetical protein